MMHQHWMVIISGIVFIFYFIFLIVLFSKYFYHRNSASRHYGLLQAKVFTSSFPVMSVIYGEAREEIIKTWCHLSKMILELSTDSKRKKYHQE